MKYLYYYFILGALVLINSGIYARHDLTMFYASTIPQSSMVNPAIQNEYRYTLGLPMLSTLQFNYDNTAFTYNDIFIPNSETSYRFYPPGIAKTNHLRDVISADLQVGWLSMSFRDKFNYFSFMVTEKASVNIGISGNTLDALAYANKNFVGEKLSVKGTAIKINHYREYALGYSRIFFGGLIVGGKIKYLSGKANVTSRIKKAYLKTDSKTYYTEARLENEVLSSAPISVSRFDNGDIRDITLKYNPLEQPYRYMFNPSNPGLAFDIGFQKRIGNRTYISGSALDLGFIYWTRDINKISQDGHYTFTGLATEDVTAQEGIGIFRDTIQSEFAISVEKKSSYITFLPVQLYFGGYYAITPQIHVGGHVHSVLYPFKIKNSLTTYARYKFRNRLEVSVNHSFLNYTYKNIGFGFAKYFKNVQLYALSDNLLAYFNPTSTRNVNVRVGMNISLGHKYDPQLYVQGCDWITRMKQKRLDWKYLKRGY